MSYALKPNEEELLCRSVGLLQAILEDGLTDDLTRISMSVIAGFKEVKHGCLSEQVSEGV